MDGHDYYSKASFEGKDVYYYRLPGDTDTRLAKKYGFAESREATIFFKGNQQDKVTIYGSAFESKNPALVVSNIERIVLGDGKSLDVSVQEASIRGKAQEKKVLWKRLFG